MFYNATTKEEEVERAARHAEANRKYYLSHRDKVIAHSNEWQKANPDKHAECMRTYRERHPERETAHRVVRNALYRGTLIRLPCRICNNPHSQAHHESYDKPLDVDWLCKKHHQEIHSKEIIQ